MIQILKFFNDMIAKVFISTDTLIHTGDKEEMVISAVSCIKCGHVCLPYIDVKLLM